MHVIKLSCYSVCMACSIIIHVIYKAAIDGTVIGKALNIIIDACREDQTPPVNKQAVECTGSSIKTANVPCHIYMTFNFSARWLYVTCTTRYYVTFRAKLSAHDSSIDVTSLVANLTNFVTRQDIERPKSLLIEGSCRRVLSRTRSMWIDSVKPQLSTLLQMAYMLLFKTTLSSQLWPPCVVQWCSWCSVDALFSSSWESGKCVCVCVCVHYQHTFSYNAVAIQEWLVCSLCGYNQ